MDATREVNATLDPEAVAGWLVRQAQAWTVAPAWGVVVRGRNSRSATMASAGVTPALEPALQLLADWILQHGQDVFVANLSCDPRVVAVGSAVGFPLACRGRVVATLVGLDPEPSRATPAMGVSAAALGPLLDLTAIALDNALMLQRAEALSVTDDLTLLFNSRYLNGVLRREAKRADRGQRPLALLFLDLDGFKQVNDNHGHLAGSKALVEAAAVIKGCARETDVVARFGGDEFAVVLPETGRDGALAVAQRIRERIEATCFLESDGLALRLTASIGVAALPEIPASAEELLRAADTSMYAVKAAGKNGVHVAAGIQPVPPQQPKE